MVTDLRRTGRQRAAASLPVRLTLLGEFSLRMGAERVPLAPSCQRLVAFLALQGGWARRSYVAGTLWGDVCDERANASLRSALWKLRIADARIVESAHEEVRLTPSARVDVQEVFDAARAVLAGRFDDVDSELFTGNQWHDLLPGWYDDWVVVERDRQGELMLLALDALSEHCTDTGRVHTAVLTALAAVEREPLRESSQRALIRAQLADGNVAGAVRHYRLYERVLHDALRIEPSAKMRDLIEPLIAQ